MSISLKCYLDNNKLVLKTKDQLFALEQIAKNQFMNKQHGYFFEFYPEKEQLVIKEKKNVYLLKKDK